MRSLKKSVVLLSICSVLVGASSKAASRDLSDNAPQNATRSSDEDTKAKIYVNEMPVDQPGISTRTASGMLVMYRGTWSAGTAYRRGDALSYQGSSYISLVNNNKEKNPETDISWAV